MARNLYVVNEEYVSKAMRIRQAARELSAYANNLSALMQRVYSSKALSSEPMARALDNISSSVRAAAASMEGVVAGIDELTGCFLLDVDDIDRYDE